MKIVISLLTYQRTVLTGQFALSSHFDIFNFSARARQESKKCIENVENFVVCPKIRGKLARRLIFNNAEKYNIFTFLHDYGFLQCNNEKMLDFEKYEK